VSRALVLGNGSHFPFIQSIMAKAQPSMTGVHPGLLERTSMERGTAVYLPLDVGQRVMLQLPRGRTWTVVRGWKDPQAVLVDVPNIGGAARSLDAGTPCQVRYFREGIYHDFRSEVLGVLALPPSFRLLTLQYPQRVDSQSLRSSPRMKLRVPARLVSHDGEAFGCVVVDLSRSGCQVKTSGFALKPGDFLRLSCLLPNQKALADVPCVVRRSYDTNSYGVEFQRMSKGQRESVDNFLGIFASFQSMEGGHEEQRGMVGELEEVSLPDLLQILAGSGKTYQVDLSDAEKWGVIHVEDGAVRHASTCGNEDPGAIFDLLGWSRGRYRVQRAEVIPKSNVDLRLEQLLLEFAFRKDQQAAGEAEIPEE
jgi:hypothetical protein